MLNTNDLKLTIKHMILLVAVQGQGYYLKLSYCGWQAIDLKLHVQRMPNHKPREFILRPKNILIGVIL